MYGENEWMNLIYLGILLIFLTLSILSRRDLKLKKVFSYLGVWALIAFILITLYSFRRDFQNVKNQIMAEIMPAKAVVNNSGQIVISASQGGHFFVNAKVNNTKLRFMVDTGASSVSISLKDAKRIGINIKKLRFNKPYQTANGIAYGAPVILDSVTISGIKFYNVKASVNSGNMGTSLLGMSFLRKLRKYEFYQDQLYLTK